jgi:predicted nucleotidyltransferase
MQLHDQATHDWSVTEPKVAEVVKRLVEAAHPRKLFLFGSYARNEAGPGSDLDILVVLADDVKNPRNESVRLRRLLRGIHMAMDIVVVPESVFAAHGDTPGMIYREAKETGRLVYDSTRE